MYAYLQIESSSWETTDRVQRIIVDAVYRNLISKEIRAYGETVIIRDLNESEFEILKENILIDLPRSRFRTMELREYTGHGIDDLFSQNDATVDL